MRAHVFRSSPARVKRLICSMSLMGLALVAAHETSAQRSEPELGMLPVQGNVYMLHGPDETNIAVQIGDDGVMLVNAMGQGLAAQIVAEIQKLTPAPIRYIINTNPDLHLTGGNAELAAKGMFGSTPALAPGEAPGATLVAHENLMRRLSDATRERRDPFPESGVPRDTFYLPFKDIYFNDEPVFVIHEPDAHTDGDSIVLFRKSDTLAVGDIFIPDQYPVIDRERGGSVQGLIRALNHILDLAVPRRLQDGGTRVIPGRGRLCNEADVVEYRNMVVIVRDRVRDLIDKGLTLSQIREAGLTRDYDGEFGGSGEAFVASVYDSLVAAR